MSDIVEAAEGAQPALQSRVRVSSPASLLAVIPPLLGFEPSEPSLVVVGTGQPRAEVRITIRLDIPDASLAAEVAGTAISHLVENRITTAAVVGYGPDSLVAPVADQVLQRFPEASITVTEALRAQDQRYWSYLCTNPECCPPEGTPFDAKAHPAAAMLAGKPVLDAARQQLGGPIVLIWDNLFEDESGQGLRPPKGRTWGRRGRTPVVTVTTSHAPCSATALL